MKLIQLLSLITVALMVGCGAVPVENKMNSAVFIDSSLNKSKSGVMGDIVNVRKMTVERHGFEDLENGRLEAWALIKNHTDFDQEIQVRVHFFDGNQLPSQFAAVAQRFFVPAKSSITARQTSIAEGMKFYQIEISGAK